MPNITIRVSFQMNWRPSFPEFNAMSPAASIIAYHNAATSPNWEVCLLFERLDTLSPYRIYVRNRQDLIRQIEVYGYCTQDTVDAINEFYSQLAIEMLAN